MRDFLYKNYLFILIISLILIKGFLWINLIPVLQAPDAERHFSTIIWYAEPNEKNWEITQNNKIVDAYNIETYNIPPEYYSFLKNYEFEKTRFNPNNHQQFSENSKVGLNENTLIKDNGSLFRHFNTLPATIIGYPKPYYIMGSWFYTLFQSNPLVNRILAVEFYTFLISLGTLFFAYKIASILFFKKREALLFAGILAFQPMFSFLSISINPDNLLIFGFSAFFYFAIKTILGNLSICNISSMILSILIAVFSKPTGYAAIPLFGVAICIGLITKYHSSKKLIAIILTSFILFFFVLFSLFLKFSVILGLTQIFSTSSKFGSYSNALMEYFKLHFTVSQQYSIFGSYWGSFGWLDYPLHTWVYALILFLIILSLIGLFMRFSKKDTSEQKPVYLFLLFSIVFFHIVILTNEFTYFKDSALLYGTQGRYFFPTIIPSLLLILLGLKSLTQKILSFERILQLLFICMITLNIYSLISVILPAYYL